MAESLSYLYGKYFQKSFNYLFPLLGLTKDEAFQAASSYLWWNGTESIENNKLIVTYESQDSLLYDSFEKKRLFGNPYFESCYKVIGGTVYIFDLSGFSGTVAHFKEGHYSKFSEGVKKRILMYHKSTLDKIPRPGRYIHMSLYPELYYEAVENEIKVDDLEKVGELMDPYNKKRETLNVEIVEKCSLFPQNKLLLGK